MRARGGRALPGARRRQVGRGGCAVRPGPPSAVPAVQAARQAAAGPGAAAPGRGLRCFSDSSALSPGGPLCQVSGLSFPIPLVTARRGSEKSPIWSGREIIILKN